MTAREHSYVTEWADLVGEDVPESVRRQERAGGSSEELT